MATDSRFLSTTDKIALVAIFICDACLAHSTMIALIEVLCVVPTDSLQLFLSLLPHLLPQMFGELHIMVTDVSRRDMFSMAISLSIIGN